MLVTLSALSSTKPNKDSIMVEINNDNTEEAVLLGVNGDKKPTSEQVTMDTGYFFLPSL